MTFWQGLAINILSHFSGSETSQESANRTQSFLICLEMLLFSIAHFYTFPVEEWKPGYRPVTKDANFGDNMALGDFLSDLRLVMGRKKRKNGKGKKGDDDDGDTSSSSFDSGKDDVDNGEVTKHLLAISTSKMATPEVKNATDRLLSSSVLFAMENGEAGNWKDDIDKEENGKEEQIETLKWMDEQVEAKDDMDEQAKTEIGKDESDKKDNLQDDNGETEYCNNENNETGNFREESTDRPQPRKKRIRLKQLSRRKLKKSVNTVATEVSGSNVQRRRSKKSVGASTFRENVSNVAATVESPMRRLKKSVSAGVGEGTTTSHLPPPTTLNFVPDNTATTTTTKHLTRTASSSSSVQ